MKLAKGEYLVKAGEKSQKVAFILEGLLRTYLITESGREKTTDLCIKGEFTSSPDVLQPESSSNRWIEALEPTTLAVTEFNTLEEFVEDRVELQYVIRKIMEDYISFKVQREEEMLSLDASGKYKKLLETYPGIEKRIPQYHIASYLGITPVSLSRIKAEMNKTNR